MSSATHNARMMHQFALNGVFGNRRLGHRLTEILRTHGDTRHIRF